jgi:TonB family protein
VRAMTAGLALALIAAPAFAQTAGDDWDLTENAATQSTVASLTYASGDTLMITCRRGAFDVLLATKTPSPTKQMAEVRFGDGEPEFQGWYPTPNPLIVMSGLPGPNVRRFRTSRTVTIVFRPDEGSTEPPQRHVLELPGKASSVDRVLDACSQARTDPRDALPRWDLGGAPGPDRGWVRFPRPEYPQAALSAGINSGFVTVSCIVGPGGTVVDCRVEKESDPRGGFGASALTAMRPTRVRMTGEGAATEGQLFTGLLSFRLR